MPLIFSIDQKRLSIIIRVIEMKYGLRIFILLLLFSNVNLHADIKYQTPPEEIAEIADADPTPIVSISPSKKHMLIMQYKNLLTIEDLARPELFIAGLRFNPVNFSQTRGYYYTGLKILNIETRETSEIKGLPVNPKMKNIRWSPDGTKIAFTNSSNFAIELWYADIEKKMAYKFDAPKVNNIIRGPYEWLSDSKTLIYKAVSKEAPEMIMKDNIPEGPIVRENDGKAAPVRTYQGLLKDKYDVSKFDFYAFSQLTSVNLDGKVQKIGSPGIIKDFNASPDGKYILVRKVKEPYSFSVPYYRFPYTAEIWNISGAPVKTIAEIPSGENMPKGFDAVMAGPRNFQWRADKPAELYWAEALDNGDPAKISELRDAVFRISAPFKDSAEHVLDLATRFNRFYWGVDDKALVKESWWKTKTYKITMFNPEKPGEAKKEIFTRNWENAYLNPGNFEMKKNRYGRSVLHFDTKEDYLYLSGKGASFHGAIPFFDALNINDLTTIRLWHSEKPYYEYAIDIYDLKHRVLITRRESRKETPNYFLRDFSQDGELTQLTEFEHPYPALEDVEYKLIQYKRKDNLDMSGKLYLPPGWEKGDDPLPVLIWAYPNEFNDRANAGQLTESPYRFIRIHPTSPILWVLRGYAVFDNPSMPIIGSRLKKPNDNFRTQLIIDAEAAVNALVALGYADSTKIAIGGHSYGAFMTANLLAHTDLFAAGIARSGAYNRTLTPFGFQSEERTLWEAPLTYVKMSPFMFADLIKEPLLLIHGQEDNNPGTFPIQSERFYEALKGHGATARLVLLPEESHGYRARESVMHTLWETGRWLDKYVKRAED